MSEETNTVTVTVDLEKVADGVQNYYEEMQDGQIAEMLGDNERAFLQAKKVISIMAQILEGILGEDTVQRVNGIASDKALAKLSAEDEARS